MQRQINKLYNKYWESKKFSTCSIYGKNILNEYKLYSKLFKRNYLKHLPKSKGVRIIDMGCGLGHFLNFLKEEGYTNIQGIDITQEAVEFCNSKNLPAIKDDITTHSFGRFDVAMMGDVIEHLEEDKILELLSNVHKNLNPGGIIIIKTPNMASILGSHSRYKEFTHKTGFSEESLDQVLRMTGFIPKIYPFDVYVIIPVINTIAKFISNIFNLLRRLIFLLYGRQCRIFTKNIYAIGRKRKE